MELPNPYLKVMLVGLGVHLVEPFYAKTIEKEAILSSGLHKLHEACVSWGVHLLYQCKEDQQGGLPELCV